ncbi:MAG: hypothetical protein Q9M25_09590 [Mariprofundaceae bacterium]|nr:hypothetical protein [Mariprofundaceae bacterium]
MARNWQEVQCELHADKAGVIWDLVLYVPTVGFLLLWGLKMWYAGGDQLVIGYGLMFLGSFFFMVGGGRVMRRLLLHPKAAVALDINRQRVKMKLKSGLSESLMKDIRFFPDHAGKSFGLTGMDATGIKRQYVFHRKQFNEDDFMDVVKALDKYK